MESAGEWSEKRVVLTGGAGFLGSHLTERLVALDANVTVVDNLRTGSRDNLAAVEDRIRFVEADVRESDAMELLVGDVAPRVVFHLAANPSVPASVQDPVYDYETNAGGAFNLLNAVRLADCCEKMVILSSGAVYGEPESVPIRESDPPRPISPYGASKLHAEVSGAMFHRVYSVPAVTARLFNVYGPRMGRFVVRDLMNKLHENPDCLQVLGTGQQVREFTYVSDAVDGLLLLAKRGTPGETYNLSSGEPITILDLAKLLVSTLGLDGRTEIACTGASWPGDAHRWEVSIDKIAELGFRPRVSLQEGLHRMISG